MRHTSAVLMMIVFLTGGMLVGMAGATAGAGAPNESNDEQATVSFEAQTSGGSTVVVEEVTLPEGGFVTMHDSSLEDGDVFGSVVGTSEYLEAGTHEDVTVSLEKPLTEDDTLFGMAHMDTDGDQIYSFVSSNGEEDGPYTVDEEPVMDGGDVTVSATVETSEQPTDGQSVLVDRVELAEGGFVTVHDSSIEDGDVFGSIRGTSAYLEAGVHEDVRVMLDEPLTDDETVYPMAHTDSNDNEVYDFEETEGEADGPYVDANGDPVMTPTDVTVSEEAAVSFDGQSSGGHTVTVADVYVPEGGFVTMHDSTLEDGAVFESVRGTSEYLEAGFHRDVIVTLDEPLTDDDTLFGMAHMDTNDNEVYDFLETEGEEDAPYTTDGDIIMDDGDVTVSASVSASAQVTDGTTVVVDRADLAEGGFVTVHDANLFAGDVFGSVVGTSAYLEAGSHEEVEITLDERLTTSQLVVPMAHMDTNDNEEYDFLETDGEEDGPYTADDDAVVDTAKVTVPASVAFEDQTDGETLVVEDVTLHDGGFVTIHDSTLADGAVFESVRGTSEYLGPGTHESVEITLEEPLTESNDVFAMAHMDTNDNEEYDFLETDGAEDAPYVAGGEPIMSLGMVTVDSADEMADEQEAGEMDADDPDSLPGFGIAVGLVALLTVGFLAGRRR